VTRGLFVAGTDTGVGKTTVGVALACLLRRAGRAPIPFKPVETGCAPEPADARRLWEAAGRPVSLAEVCPFPLALPAAPSAAAAEVGLRLDVADLARRGLALVPRGDFLLAEGAGGLLAPYQGATTNADLAAHLGLPILVVGRTALGTINHVALTLAELGRRRVPVAGVLLARTTAGVAPHEATNVDLIQQVTGVRPLGTLPFLSEAELADPERIADALAGALPPQALARLLGQSAQASGPPDRFG
jgi:dethiobiotin synthetase